MRSPCLHYTTQMDVHYTSFHIKTASSVCLPLLSACTSTIPKRCMSIWYSLRILYQKLVILLIQNQTYFIINQLQFFFVLWLACVQCNFSKKTHVVPVQVGLRKYVVQLAHLIVFLCHYRVAQPDTIQWQVNAQRRSITYHYMQPLNSYLLL